MWVDSRGDQQLVDMEGWKGDQGRMLGLTTQRKGLSSFKDFPSPSTWFHWECEKIERGNSGSWLRTSIETKAGNVMMVIKRHYALRSTLHQQMAVDGKWEKEQKTQHIPQARSASANWSALASCDTSKPYMPHLRHHIHHCLFHLPPPVKWEPLWLLIARAPTVHRLPPSVTPPWLLSSDTWLRVWILAMGTGQWDSQVTQLNWFTRG